MESTGLTQEERIRRYEAMRSEVEQAISAYETALDRFEAIQNQVAALNDYYGSEAWWEDFRASEEGRLPADLLCGVLSEDGIWDLLTRNRELQANGPQRAEEAVL